MATGNSWKQTDTQSIRDYSNIPPTTLQSLVDFIEHGRLGGHFVSAVLTNDLAKAFQHADLDNIRGLWAIVTWLYNRAPQSAFGNEEKVRTWHLQGGLAQVEKAGMAAPGTTVEWREKAVEGTALG